MNKTIKEKVNTSSDETPKETPKSRQENYFFPKERKTIMASSLGEAIEKLKK